ncbi:efflux transporter outer membrane subunit [Bacteroides sp. 214]|uniref:efflux transporter outer membrane subunit n=1 Tax=Bacteroides sp. 214 TaxID=2302935 RepID=UPI0013D6AAFB|nr:efflux transporter outer membrane subunit [Bacteroides sp. 214]NDW12842.1 efflux transporter outer membrane subunit [Bacteroides sp. 214]
MKLTLLISMMLLLSSCGIYKTYHRPDLQTDTLYGTEYVTTDTTTLASIKWRELFTDPHLQALIAQGLENNTDLQAAWWRVEEAKAVLATARLSYLPSFNFAPNGGVSSFDKSKASWTYATPVVASWELDIFAKITNAKRQAKSLLLMSEDYRQAVQTGLIAGIATQYYTLLLLDEQLKLSTETAEKFKQSVAIMKLMKQAGMANEVGISQIEGAYYSVVSALEDIKRSINEIENSLSATLCASPHHIERGNLESISFPTELKVGVPLQLLAHRPDIRAAEQSLVQAHYATNIARASLYPSITLSGTAGWTNSLGSLIVNPGKLLLTAAGTLSQPIFNAGSLRGKVKIAKAQQEQAKLSFQQALLNAGGEVNNALTQYQTAQAKSEWRTLQVEALQNAVSHTELLMQHSSTTYLDVLTAQQSLLQAQTSQAQDRFEMIQGVINLYQALGGGVE